MHAKKSIFIFLILAIGATLVLAQAGGEASPKGHLDQGITLFSQGKYRESLDLFGNVLADPQAKTERPEAAYWAVLAYLAVGEQSTASASIDAYLSAYPQSSHVPDLLYQKGRILYGSGDYEGAIRVFAAFSEAAPNSDLFPSAIYWSGESLYALGRLEDAERAFRAIVQNYPSSVKVEAATYRISLIGLEYRQRELLKLLTWSHEESLRAVEDFRRREKAYEASIALYQKQISDSKRGAASSGDKELADLRAQVADLGSQLEAAQAKTSTLQTECDALRKELANAQTATAPSAISPLIDKDTRSAALDAKARALDLLAYYLDKLTATSAKDGSK